MCRKHICLLGILSFMGVVVLMIAASQRVFASTTDGTINATNRYAWSENLGWIDFGTTQGDVRVKDSELQGYAWGENIGWISLNCANDSSCDSVNYKVTNTTSGVLGGYAWSENVGWIQFAPTNGGVTIDASGVFSGYAWGENTGWIVLNCSNQSSCATVDYKVSTDWRTGSARVAEEAAASPSDATTGGSHGGSRGGGGSVGMAQRIAAARAAILARFDAKLRRQEVVVEPSITPPLESPSETEAPAETPSDIVAPSVAARRAERVQRQGILVTAVEGVEIAYHDVPLDSWFAPYVSEVIEDGIAQGYRDGEGNPTGEFGVADSITSAEILRMALMVAGKSLVKTPPRNNSARNTWASQYVATAETMGLTIADSTRNMHLPATRAEVIRTILEVLGIPIGETAVTPGGVPYYSDVPQNHPHANAIAAATFYGLTAGDTAADGTPLSTFRPDDPMNRAEAAKIIALAKRLAK